MGSIIHSSDDKLFIRKGIARNTESVDKYIKFVGLVISRSEMILT